MVKVAAIVLAAGTSSRFSQGSTKLVANFEGKPLVRHAVDAATASLAFPVIVVTGHAREDVRTALRGAEVVFVHNMTMQPGSHPPSVRAWHLCRLASRAP
jgi:molybdenum cofactor cytidylyltransferase